MMENPSVGDVYYQFANDDVDIDASISVDDAGMDSFVNYRETKDPRQFLANLQIQRQNGEYEEDLGNEDANPFGNIDDEDDWNESLKFPLYVPKPAEVLPWDKKFKKIIRDLYYVHHWKVILIGIWLLCNLALFASALYNYLGVKLSYRDLSRGIAAARAFAWTIVFNLFIMLFLINARLVTFLHGFLFHGVAKLLRKSHYVHKYLAYLIFIGSAGHTCAHIYNLKALVTASYDQINFTLGPEKADLFYGGNTTSSQVGKYFVLLFSSAPTLTGIIMICAFATIYVTTRFGIRAKKFHIFYGLHVCMYATTIICLFAHGSGKWLNEPSFAGAVLAPVIILYILDRGLLLYRRRPLDIAYLQESQGVIYISLKFESFFKFKTGQYCKICVPQISLLEYHPFSIMSAPGDGVLQLGIKDTGDWTHKLATRIKENEQVTFYFDGGFGANAQFFLKYDSMLLVSTGIGCTPFVAVLKYLRKQPVPTVGKMIVYFIWMGSENAKAYPFILEACQDLQSYWGHKNKHAVFIPKLFFTRMKAPDASVHPDPNLGLLGEGVVTYGSRPLMQDIFVEVVTKYDHLFRKFGVFVCGNEMLMKTLFETCHLFNEQTNTDFTLYREGF